MKRDTSLLLLSLLIPFYALAGIPEGYYDAANGKKKAALKAALHAIIQPETLLTYGSGAGHTWTGFYTTDRMPDGQVIDRYSYDKRYFPASASEHSASAVSGMNIEHSFPKSWWGGANNNAYKDLFNLMPCEQTINSSKSNYAMGKVTNVKTTNGCTKVGTGPTSAGETANLWEPADEWKGDFARDYFYMVTTYSNLTWTSNGLDMLEKDDYPTMQQWAYTLLLEWSRQDPVDEIELARNDAVYGIQGNRNPFVDFPNLAEYVWGDSVDYAFNTNGTTTGGGGSGGDEPNPDFATLVDCTMTSGLDPFFVRTAEGEEGIVWTSTTKYGAVGNAYNIDGKTADEYLMVSLNLAMMQDAVLTFEHATGYNKTASVEDTYFQVLVSYDYDGVPEDATWLKLDAQFPPLPSSSSFSTFVSSGDISLASACGRPNVTLAFRYTSNSTACYAWEIKNVKVTAQEMTDALPLLAQEDDDDYGTSFYDEAHNAPTYDLAGRRVPAGTKGLVIRGGRMILQK